MATVDRTEANQKMLQQTNEVQDKTKEAIWRIQRQAAEAEQIGTKTLDELRRQGQQMDDINNEIASVSSKLDQSKALQSRFDRWAGNWLGGKKSAALREAAAEINERNVNEHTKIKEVFQHEKFDSLSRTWKKAGLVLCTDPSVSCDDVFDPALQETLEKSSWSVDFSLQGIDAEGWTYAYDFATLNKVGAGDKEPKWNSYVRRRKWRYVEQRAGMGGSAVDEVVQRNEERKNKASASNKLAQAGYVPRNKQPTASGLTSSTMVGKGKAKDQELDNESAAGLKKVQETDSEINAGLAAIDKTLDNLNALAGAMKDETLAHNEKLERIDNSMQKTMEKQTVVNARQRFLLK